MSLTDDANLCVRYLVRTALQMPANSVRPANQAAPRGAQNEQFATVMIMGTDDIGTVDREIESDGQGGINEALYQPERFVAHVQFFGTAKKDGAGIGKYNTEAYDLARRLPRLLDFSSNQVLMQQLGLGYLSAGRARNLAGVADSTWESRGSVDLTFNIISREAMQIASFATPYTPVIKALSPGPSIAPNGLIREIDLHETPPT